MVWDVDKETAIKSLADHLSVICSVAWSLDGKRFASGSGDQTVRLYDAKDYKLLKTLTGRTGQRE